jgi:hypothetical protein
MNNTNVNVEWHNHSRRLSQSEEYEHKWEQYGGQQRDNHAYKSLYEPFLSTLHGEQQHQHQQQNRMSPYRHPFLLTNSYGGWQQHQQQQQHDYMSLYEPVLLTATRVKHEPKDVDETGLNMYQQYSPPLVRSEHKQHEGFDVDTSFSPSPKQDLQEPNRLPEIQTTPSSFTSSSSTLPENTSTPNHQQQEALPVSVLEPRVPAIFPSSCTSSSAHALFPDERNRAEKRRKTARPAPVDKTETETETAKWDRKTREVILSAIIEAETAASSEINEAKFDGQRRGFLSRAEEGFQPKNENENKSVKKGKQNRYDFGSNWERMFQRLLDYRKVHGHTWVKTKYPPDPRLGTWVRNQRIRNNQGKMKEERKRKLTEADFIWNMDSSDRSKATWDEMFLRIVEYKVTHRGDANVPIKYQKDQKLGFWVNYQRVSYRRGKLSPDKIAKLNLIQLEWHPK